MAKSNAQRQSEWRGRRARLTTLEVEALVRAAYYIGFEDATQGRRQDFDYINDGLQWDASALAELNVSDDDNAVHEWWHRRHMLWGDK